MIYLDSNVTIRLVEGDASTRRPIEERLVRYNDPFVTSQLSRLECRLYPVRSRDAALLALYDQFFAGDELSVVDISTPIIDKATELRARFNLRTPDAIHLATGGSWYRGRPDWRPAVALLPGRAGGNGVTAAAGDPTHTRTRSKSTGFASAQTKRVHYCPLFRPAGRMGVDWKEWHERFGIT